MNNADAVGQRSANFVCKGPGGDYFGFCWPRASVTGIQLRSCAAKAATRTTRKGMHVAARQHGFVHGL